MNIDAINEKARELANFILDSIGQPPLTSSEEKFIIPIIKQVLLEVRRDALEEACGVVFGQCESDNVAQRTVDAIRKMKESEA